MANFPIAEAELTALVLQSIAYGMHVVTFAACLYTWFYRPSDSNAGVAGRRLWMLVAMTFFFISTCSVSLNYYHNLVAFIFYRGPGGANEEFDQFTNWVNFIRNIFYDVNEAVSDVALIYRCWLVHAYSRRRAIVAIAPLILWLGWLAITILLVYYKAILDHATSIPATREIQPFIYTCYSITLIINVFSTGLIIVRLWNFHRRSAEVFTQNWRGRGRLNLVRMILIIVESALLYTTTVIVCIALDIVGSNAYYCATNLSFEAAGISFDLIIIRIWNGVSTEQTQAFADTELHLSKGRTIPHEEEVGTVRMDLDRAIPHDTEPAATGN
ncbi:hypothetical protein DAEQUDRAFT_765372 [Daedalea quercina L-15889]|uniref:Uncharacterized protein n=1 Tax=Daedalea quercina L-15889 TaxID=1314783 RepID=A0A165QIZ5_9APHY|nr:hypothetical protein DAEQUDRAFT_765372 [Daedalea quercina L-15889]